MPVRARYTADVNCPSGSAIVFVAISPLGVSGTNRTAHFSCPAHTLIGALAHGPCASSSAFARDLIRSGVAENVVVLSGLTVEEWIRTKLQEVFGPGATINVREADGDPELC